jgi:sugar lactone lactonase YvrE
LTRAFAGIAALAVILGSGQAVGAGKSRLRWVRSIYIDAKGGGLKHPEGLACGDDFLVVADTGNERLLRYSYQGDSVTADGELLLPKSHPIRVQVNSKGDVYYLDGRERRIVVIDATGEDKGALKPKSLPFSTQMVAKSFAIARNDDIYVLDVFSAQVLVLDAAGQYLRHVPFPKTYGFFSDLAVDAQGTIFILDGIEAAVYSAARGADSFSPFTESMKDVMNFPTSLSVDRSGILYLVDQYGSGLALVGQDGEFLGRKLRMGWNESGLYYPSEICISRNGNLFIADRNNNRVQLFTFGERGSDAGSEGDR